MKILILGATGMLGYQVFRTCLNRGLDVHALVRDTQPITEKIGVKAVGKLHKISDIKIFKDLDALLLQIKPTHIINCIGIVKQSTLADNHIEAITINSLLPHFLTKACESINAKLIHVSTDCVFDGNKGNYKETDLANAQDLYGRTKLLGETGYGTAVTLRTSIIGHEINSATHGLVDWFLAQSGLVNGYTNAFFSGLTTLELTNVILDYVIKLNISTGIYQVSADRISKFDLITLIADKYRKVIDIVPSSDLVIDRSLNSTLFKSVTGYKPPSWEKLIVEMRSDFLNGF